jgi:hypothetical protein
MFVQARAAISKQWKGAERRDTGLCHRCRDRLPAAAIQIVNRRRELITLSAKRASNLDHVSAPEYR